jgi:hypothetical protein
MTVIVAAALVVGTGVLAGGSGTPSTRSVVARPGDTVLSLVLRETPDVDPASAVTAVEELNGLSDGELPTGTVLRVPAS